MRRSLADLEAGTFDLVVIGGGIYGACAAWDAAQRGLSVALVERDDFVAKIRVAKDAQTDPDFMVIARTEAFVARLESFDEATFAIEGTHPRLKKPMRMVDHCFFVAEHDDHHLAAITDLRRRKTS